MRQHLTIHQMGSVLAYGDAVTNHIVEIDRRLSRWGLDSRIYGAEISLSPTDKAQLSAAYRPFLNHRDDVLIYHYSAYCDNYTLFQESKNRKILVYHNITPAEYYHHYDATYELLCARGRRVLAGLTDCDLAVGVSEYNRQELVSAGFRDTTVLPLFLGVDDFAGAERNPELYRRLKSKNMTNVLFVGRVAPNKAFEELLKIFSVYHHYINPQSRLILAGARFLPRYDRVLDTLVERLHLAGVVLFTDRIPFQDLKTYFEAADLFVCASHHEGFCIPLLEAMHFDLPILGRAETGVPYTMETAGVLYHRLDYPVLAEMMQLLLTDQALRAQIIAGQRRRLADFAPERVELILRDVLRAVGVSVEG